MSSFVFNNAIPAAPNNPSVDQPDMLTNNISTDAILAINHISFNAAKGGTHLLVNFTADPNFITPPVAPLLNDSILYTQAGVASTSAALFFQNAQTTLVISSVKAWALCNGAAGGIVAGQSMNVASVVRNSTGRYTVTLMTNAVNSTNIAILITTSSGAVGAIGATYVIGALNVFNINTFITTSGILIDPTTFTFQVMQL
jgi:hypothetical protein